MQRYSSRQTIAALLFFIACAQLVNCCPMSGSPISANMMMPAYSKLHTGHVHY